ncbi:MAG: P-type conjugative transfer protein TrbL [Phycisphaerae bacterium]|jgi:type IV secretion system protein TrbL
MSIINETLQQYLDAINSGFGFIGGDVRWLFNILVLLNIVVAALFWAFSEDQILVPLIRKILYIGIFAWIVENWVELTNILAQTFMLLGIKAGGGHVDHDILLNPGDIAERGLTTITPMIQAIRDLSGPVAFFENFAEILLLTLATLAVIAAFFLIAIQAAMAILTFKLGSLAAFVLLPFSLITHTAFMAERPLGWVVTAGVRLMLLTLVVGLGEAIFARLEITPEQLTIRTALDIALGAIVLMVLALTSSRLASDLATGTPRLGALDAGIALGGVAVTATYATRKVLAGAGHVASGARLAAAKAASGISGAAKSFRANSKDKSGS